MCVLTVGHVYLFKFNVFAVHVASPVRACAGRPPIRWVTVRIFIHFLGLESNRYSNNADAMMGKLSCRKRERRTATTSNCSAT